MIHKEPPKGTHVTGARKGEELVRTHGREPGRGEGKPHRNARDATGLCADERQPIDPRMPNIPPS